MLVIFAGNDKWYTVVSALLHWLMIMFPILQMVQRDPRASIDVSASYYVCRTCEHKAYNFKLKLFYRWFEVFYRLILHRLIRGYKLNPKESKMIIGCVIVVLAARSFWSPYSSLSKEILFCLVLIMIGIGVFIVSPYSYHQNWKRNRCGNLDGKSIYQF